MEGLNVSYVVGNFVFGIEKIGYDHRLDTTGLGFRLWSQAVKVNKEHMIKYTFDSKQDFNNLFNCNASILN